MREEEAIQERKVTKVLQGWMVSKELQVHLEKKENLVHVVCQENLGLKGQKDLRVQEVRLDHLAHLERREKWAFPVSLDILEEEEQRVIEVWLAREVEMVPVVLLEIQVQMVTEENWDQEDQEGREASEVFQVPWVLKVKLDPLVPQVHQVPQV